MRIVPVILAWLLRCILRLRYQVSWKGSSYHPSRKGTLILANHPALVDPLLLTAYLWPKTKFHPVAADFLSQSNAIRWGMGWFHPLYVPVFDASNNSYKQYRIDQAYEKILNLLNRGESILIYPSGELKGQGREEIGGASGVYHLLQHAPDIEIYMIRTTGLWGSMFSRALTGKSPDILPAFWQGFLWICKNLIFFTPKRKLTLHAEYATDTFPRKGTKKEINVFLENWFNANGPEPLTLVSYHFAKILLPKIADRPMQPFFSIEKVPANTKELVYAEIAQLAGVEVESLHPGLQLSHDLGLDSLDRSQLVLLLRESFGVLNVPVLQLTTVGVVLGLAARLLSVDEGDMDELELKTPDWEDSHGRPQMIYPEGNTLIENFFLTADRLGGWVAAVDPALGEVSYQRMKWAILVLAQSIRKLPGTYIGVLLPASIAANVLIFAIQLAGKVPVMINWTLGGHTLRSIVEQTQIQVTLSSWKVLNKLDNIDLSILDQQILTLEEMKQGTSLFTLLFSWVQSHFSTRYLLRMWRVSPDPQATAVVLFTSGTENVPKAVPLTHHNLISNQRAALSLFPIHNEDALISFLPPFHSFGFSVTGILPLLIGWRVAYLPNPTQSRRLVQAIQRWKITTVCGVPTFLRMMIRSGDAEQLRSVQLLISGAESIPDALLEECRHVMPKAEILEGYGITECSPILTMTPPGLPRVGVGRPLPGIELLIIDPDRGVALPKGTMGLVLARGPNVFSGYLFHNHNTNPFMERDGVQWYVTGDLGVLDEQNNLTLMGRLKRFVKIGGEMVGLGGIELLLQEIAKKGKWGPIPETPSFAVCALGEGDDKTQLHLFSPLPITKQEANEVLREQGMSNLVRITAVHAVHAIPLLGSGKINYRQLHAQYLSRD